MKLQEFTARVRLPVSADEAYAWHARPGAFQRLSPPWQHVEVIEQGAGLSAGTRVVMRLRAGPLRKRWVAVHGACVPGREFRDSAERGPFAHWEHVHRFEPDGPDACWLTDRVQYALPMSLLTQPLLGAFARGELARLFRYRHDTTRADLAAHAAHAEHLGGRPMRVLVSGASGLVGRQLVAFLSTGGHEVVRLQRSGAHGTGGAVGESPVAGAPSSVAWEPASGAIDREALEGLDAVVHLAGENIAARRWNPAHKEAVRSSRVGPTAALARALGSLRRKPAAFLCASAIGYYGDRGDELLTERSEAGAGFLPEVCEAWESATAPAAAAGIRTVNLRIGTVLSPQGGALGKLLLPFRLGGGGPIGSGRQWWSWISLDDLVGAMHHALFTDSLSGPCNAVSPQPLPNADFARALGAVLHRPALLPLPAPVARKLVGEMADALLLSSTRVVPIALLGSDYAFRHAELRNALRHMLGSGAA